METSESRLWQDFKPGAYCLITAIGIALFLGGLFYLFQWR